MFQMVQLTVIKVINTDDNEHKSCSDKLDKYQLCGQWLEFVLAKLVGWI